jgi:hypothetical protein
VSCQRIAGHGHEITEEIGVRLQAKNETCSAATINNKIHQLELSLGLPSLIFYIQQMMKNKSKLCS